LIIIILYRGDCIFMAGNELVVTGFLLRNLGTISLKHLGPIAEIGAPTSRGYKVITSLAELSSIATEDAGKKADIYINGKGVSIKQSGGSFSFNRLQRDNILAVFNKLGFSNPETKLARLDKEVEDFHRGLLGTRNRPWRNIFTEDDFKALLKFLMMLGSPNKGISSHPAEIILEAPPNITSANQINTYTFDDYFNTYSNNLVISIRRQWIGQNSNSEHKRASGLAKKKGNLPWVYNDVVGEPNSGWMPGFPFADRRTVYFLMIEKV